MKKNIILLAILFLISLSISAQNDVMYFMKNGRVVNQQSIAPADVDSVIFYEPEGLTEPFVDVDGNEYRTVKIGDQIWMAENLRVTSFPDGSKIPFYSNDNEWKGVGDTDEKVNAGYCWYNDDASLKESYGALYSYAGALHACPEGWHLPTEEDWTRLELELGMTENEVDGSGFRGTSLYVGSQMSGNASLWIEGVLITQSSSNFGSSGLDLIPGGQRNAVSGECSQLGENGYYWVHADHSNGRAYARNVYYNNGGVEKRGNIKSTGHSVRYVKD